MRGKKWLLMLTITFLLGAVMVSVSPVKAPYASVVRVYVVPLRPSYVAGQTVGTFFNVEVYIDSPPGWTGTSSGITGWRMDVHANASVLEPTTIYGATVGYWLFDFADGYGYTTSLLKTVDKPGGDFDDVSEFIMGYGTLGVGAGGSGLLCRLRYKSLSQTWYTLIDLMEFKYAKIDYPTVGWYTANVVVIDGNYNVPPFLFLHSVSGLINLASPACTYWHELWPSYCTNHHLNRWLDTSGDGKLSPCDAIQLDTTSWYHVKEVTATIKTNSSIIGTPTTIMNDPGSSSGGWTNGAGAHADGGTYASVTSGTPSASQVYEGYGFTIPAENVINQVRVRYDAWSIGGASANQQRVPTGDGDTAGTYNLAKTRVPTADGDISGTWDTSPRWDDVDEVTFGGTDGDSDYMTGTTDAGGWMLFTFSSFAVPTGATITNLMVYIRAADTPSSGSNNIRQYIKVGDSYHIGGSNNPGTTPETFAYTWANNPKTNAAWTVDDINGVGTNPLQQIGVNSTDLIPDMRVYNVFAVVNYAFANNLYTAVDETTPDDTDLLVGTATTYRLFTFPAFTVPAGSTITNLAIYYRACDVATVPGTNNIRAAIKSGGSYYATTDAGQNPGATFTTYSYTFATNPKTTAAWTLDDINGVGANPLQQFGISSSDLSPNAGISMVYAQVNYVTANNERIRVQVSWDGGTTWSSQQTTDLTGTEATYWYDVTAATSWTPEKLNNTNFRVRVDAYTVGDPGDVRLDWIPVSVTHTPFYPMYFEFLDGLKLYMDSGRANPEGTRWHEIYPAPSKLYNLTSWTDSDTSGNITVCDYLNLKNATGYVKTYHVKGVYTDIIVGGPIPSPPEFPLGLAIEISLIIPIIYICWRIRRKTKITKRQITTPPNR